MIWDRFDDAMDDLDDDEDRSLETVRSLESKLRDVGIEPGRWEPPRFWGTHKEFEGPHDAYLDRRDEISAVHARVQELTRMWNEHLGRQPDATIDTEATTRNASEITTVTAEPPRATNPATTVNPVTHADPAVGSDPAPGTTAGSETDEMSWFWTLYTISVIAAFGIGYLLGTL